MKIDKYYFFAKKLGTYLKDISEDCEKLTELLDEFKDVSNDYFTQNSQKFSTKEDAIETCMMEIKMKQKSIMNELEFQTKNFSDWKF